MQTPTIDDRWMPDPTVTLTQWDAIAEWLEQQAAVRRARRQARAFRAALDQQRADEGAWLAAVRVPQTTRAELDALPLYEGADLDGLFL